MLFAFQSRQRGNSNSYNAQQDRHEYGIPVSIPTKREIRFLRMRYVPELRTNQSVLIPTMRVGTDNW